MTAVSLSNTLSSHDETPEMFLTFKDVPSLPSLETETGEFYLVDRLTELYRTDPIIQDFINLNTLPYTVLEGDCDLSKAWAFLIQSPPRFPMIDPLIINRKLEWKPLNMVKLNGRRINRKGYFAYDPRKEVTERRRVLNYLYLTELPFCTTEPVYEEQISQAPKLNRFFNKLDKKDLVEIMNRADIFHGVYDSMFHNDHEDYCNYLISLYENSSITSLYIAISNFKIGEDKSNRRFNKKMLKRLNDHLVQFLECSPREEFELQVGILNNLSSFMDGIGQTNQVMAKFSNLLDRMDIITEKVDSTTTAVADSTSNVQSITNQLVNSSSINTLGTIIERAKKNLPVIVAHFIKIFKCNSFSDWTLSLSSILSILGVGEMAYDKIINYFSTSPAYIEQSKVKLLALISTFLGKYSPVQLLTDTSAFTLMREQKAITEMMTLLEDLAIELGIMSSPEVELANALKIDVTSLIENCVTYNTLLIEKPDKFLFSRSWDAFKKDYDRVKKIQETLVHRDLKHLNSTTLKAEALKLRDNYDKLYSTITQLRRSSDIRQEPLALCFLGKPGIGKSKFTLELVSNSNGKQSALTKRYYERGLDKLDNWYDLDVPHWQSWNECLSSGTQYSDGYIGQDIHIVDDIFQAGDDSEHLKWVNYISPAQYLTNQAALEAKGFPYTSKLCLTSANQFPRSSKTIKDITALQRRFVVVHTEKIKEPSASYDPTFAHLKFTVYNTATDYVAASPVPGKVMTFSELTNFILDRIQLKYKMFCNSTGIHYEEQIAPANVKVVTHDEFMQLANNAPVLNIQDICSDQHKRFHRIFIKPGSEMATKYPGNSRLIEFIKDYPDFRSSETLFEYFDSWIDSSPSFSTKAAGYCHLSKWQPSYYFHKNGTIYKTIPTEDEGEFDIDEETWIDWLYDKIPSPFKNVAETVYSWMKQQFVFLGKFLYSTWEDMKAATSKFSKLTGIEAIITWLFPESITETLLKYLKGYLVSFIIGTLMLCVYSKLTRFFTKSRCHACENVKTNKVARHLKQLIAENCNETCALGYIYNSHTEECKTLPDLVTSVEALYCCAGECDEHCTHNMDLENFDTRSLEPLFKIMDEKLRNGRDAMVTYLPEFVQEASDNSKRQKAKTCLILEASDNSGKMKKKSTFTTEGSDTSTRAKKKSSYTAEGSDVSQKQKVKTTFNIEGSDGPHYQEEVQQDPGCFSAFDTIRNIMTKVQNRSGALWGWGYGNYVIAPGHIVNGTDIILKDASGSFVNAEVVNVNHKRDICLLRFEGNPFNQSLMRHLVSINDVENTLQNNKGAILGIPRGENNNHILHIKDVSIAYEKRITVTTGTKDYEQLLHVTGLHSHGGISTTAGDCGSPLLIMNPRVPRKLAGFHVIGARDSKTGFSALVTKEFVEAMIQKDQLYHEEASYDSKIECGALLPVLDTMDLVPREADRTYLASKGDIEYVGEYKYRSIPAKDSNLEEHRLFGTFPVTAVPAALSNDEVEDQSQLHLNGYEKPDILQTQINKYATTFANPEGLNEHLYDMTKQLTHHMKNVLSSYDLSPLSEQETLSGLEDDDMKGMDLRTTAGEPFARWGRIPGKKKKEFLSEHRSVSGKKLYTFNRNVQHALDLVEEINLKEKLAHQGVRTLSIWKNCLKDETRPLAKQKIGKTRLFTAAPFDTVYLGRKYFGRFKEAWQTNRMSLFHSVGINPTSADWTLLAHKLLQKGDLFYDADYSSYDGRLRADFMRAAGKVVVDTIGQNTTLLNTLWEEYVETFHVGISTVQLIKHGNPSGNPMTTVVNCIVNFMYHWYAYRMITDRTSLSAFDQEVGFTCFGDDVVFCSSLDSKYTFSRVAKIMHDLGQEYTTAAKDSKISGARPIGEITFLKRRFKKSGNIYTAPLDTDSIEQQFNYTYIGQNDYMTMQTQLDEACCEAALHGNSYYKGFSKKLRKAIGTDEAMQRNMSGVLTYADAHARIMERTREDAKPASLD